METSITMYSKDTMGTITMNSKDTHSMARITMAMDKDRAGSRLVRDQVVVTSSRPAPTQPVAARTLAAEVTSLLVRGWVVVVKFPLAPAQPAAMSRFRLIARIQSAWASRKLQTQHQKCPAQAPSKPP
jgi:hypothetical protein